MLLLQVSMTRREVGVVVRGWGCRYRVAWTVLKLLLLVVVAPSGGGGGGRAGRTAPSPHAGRLSDAPTQLS